MKNNFNEMKEKNGAVTFEGKEYALTEQAEAWNEDYHAGAIDERGVEYLITWEVTAEYEEKLEELIEENGNYWLDEADACDWENPITVEKVW